MNDLVVRLLLKTAGFDADLGKAKNSVDAFAKQITSNVTGAVMKFAGALTAVAGAASAFEGVIRGSQTTSDEFDRVMRTAKTSVESFFTAVSTGDFTAFNRGFDDIISRARLANDALDQLGNTTMSYGYFNARNQAELADALTILRDKNATASEKEAAKAAADRIMGNQKEITEQLRVRTQNAIAALVTEKNTLGLNNITKLDIDEILALDVSAMGDAMKEDLKASYKEYEAIYNSMVGKYTTLQATSELGKFEKKVDYVGLNKAMESVTNKYQMAILYNEILVRNSDDWLRNLIGIQQASDNADRSLANMQRQLNRAGQSDSGGEKTSGVKKNGLQMPIVVSQVQYNTELGKKVLEWMNGKEVPVIKAEIEIEGEDIDEEDLSGKWGEHLKDIENMNSALSSTGEIFGSLGGVMASFGNDMGAWMMQSLGNVANMIVQLQSLATANGVASASKLPFPANIAGIATVVATIASIFSSLPKFADGGIVGGSSYFGDKLLARVNSGEAVLTQSQQARALSLMNGSNVRVSGDVRLSGKDIYISLRNYMSSSGNKL